MTMSTTTTTLLLVMVLCSISWIPPFCSGFYLPGSYMHTYSRGDSIFAKVNSLTSIETELPFGYYTLPYCTPPGGVIKKSAENLGELLMGDQIDTSPYRFRININESLYLCTTPPLDDHDVSLLKQRTRDFYKVNMILDNLPVKFLLGNGFPLGTGFPVGYFYADGQSFIINHLKFKVLLHEYQSTGFTVIADGTGGGDVITEADDKINSSRYEIVGFEAVHCSVRRNNTDEIARNFRMYNEIDRIDDCPRDLGSLQIIRQQERITFTYQVEFVKSEIRWPSRWDAYLKMGGARVELFSILSSLMVIFFLAAIVFVIFLRTVRRDLARYEQIDKEEMNGELSGWKLVAGDVFREPPCSKLLCIVVGDGVQITGMAAVTIVFAAFGFLSPAFRGMLLTGMIILYLILGIVAGYAGVRLWITLKGTSEGWRSLSWSIACFFSGIVFVIHSILNFILWGSHSTGAIPISRCFGLIGLWFCISVPLTLLGGLMGTYASHIQFPIRTNRIPREIPARKCPSWMLILGAGTLPFGTLFVELCSVISSIWFDRFDYHFGFLLIVLVMLVVVCTEVSVISTYMHLCAEDWRWWWKAFFASGSVAFYVFFYLVLDLVTDLDLSGPVSVILCIGYSLTIAIAILLAAGAIGFLTSLYFVRCLFSSVKID